MSAWDDLMQALQQRMYSNPYVQQGQAGSAPQQQTLGQMASSTGGGAATHLALHPEYVKYALAAQEQGQAPIPYDAWLTAYMQAQQQQTQPQVVPSQQ